MQPWKIYISFEDGSRHVTEDIRFGRPGWGDVLFTKGIKQIVFPFTVSNCRGTKKASIILRDMKEYNFFVECAMNVLSGKMITKGVWFLGQKGDSDVDAIIITPDMVVFDHFKRGREYRGEPSGGWKSGLSIGNPRLEIREGWYDWSAN